MTDSLNECRKMFEEKCRTRWGIADLDWDKGSNRFVNAATQYAWLLYEHGWQRTACEARSTQPSADRVEEAARRMGVYCICAGNVRLDALTPDDTRLLAKAALEPKP